MATICLNGAWELYGYSVGTSPVFPCDVTGEHIPAAVPGNVEIDLMNAGKLPNIYQGDHVEKTREFELHDWWYVKEFSLSEIPENTDNVFVFDGVDTYAEYYLNGEKLGESDNMFIAHEFAVDGVLKTGKNRLAVHIRSAIKAAEGDKVSPSMVADWQCFENLRTRKPSHAYGWDIFPRDVSAGIWRSVRLEFRPKIRIENLYFSTVFAKTDLAGTCFHYELKLPATMYGKCKIVFSGQCEDRAFSFTYPVTYKAATKFPYIEKPLLWWPNGMGKPNLYDVTVSLYTDSGELLDERKTKWGIRHVVLERGDFLDDNAGFRFTINGEFVLCKGANWVPLDVLHAKDEEKYEECVLNYVENHSNMVRVWGGGVYENERFFELCDRHGIMVWQDFMLACHAYPQDEEFCKKLYAEAESVIKRIRNHPSLVLYCGSNETDWIYFCTGQDPNDDVLTRKVLPQAIRDNDPYRIYYPTSPLFTKEYVKQRGGKFLIDLDEIEQSRTTLPEEHYWWHRDDYETYAKMHHRFVGEIGYSGCIARASLEECLGKDALQKEKFFEKETWKLHDYSTDGDILHASKYYFGFVPDDVDDFILSSQILQAEAYKFLIEQTRIKKPYMTGILLWNMRDGWPAYNSALVDYYGRKKLSHYYVRQAQQPLTMIMDEGLNAYVCNDSLQAFSGKYKIYDEKNILLKEGTFELQPNVNANVGTFTELQDVKYLVLAVEVNGETYYNHFINEKRAHDFVGYKNFLRSYNGILQAKDVKI
ncbi:MAG: hypothetical protein IJY63_05265 [Clostridia bacterium]|nr:hypothetical protein [Clostridia bacterium]